jgi:hypothetical protein
MAYACPTWEFAADTHLKIVVSANKGSPHQLQISKEHADS